MEFKQLELVLDDLPEMTIGNKSYKPIFSYGSQADLLKWLRLKNKSKGKKYPLVWLETPFTSNRELNTETAKINLIIATLSNANLSNRERTSLTFATTLDPLLENVIKAFKYSLQFRVIDNSQSITKHFNYDGNEYDKVTKATDIWDAISLEITIELNLNCI